MVRKTDKNRLPPIEFELSISALTNMSVGPVGATVLRRVIAVVESIACNWVQKTIACHEKYKKISLIPETRGAAAIELYLDDDGEIGFSMGEDAYFNLPEDIQVPKGYSLESYVEEILRAVICGGLRETVYTRGGVIYRSVFHLDVKGRDVSIARTNLPKFLCGLFRHHVIRTTQYKPCA